MVLSGGVSSKLHKMRKLHIMGKLLMIRKLHTLEETACNDETTHSGYDQLLEFLSVLCTYVILGGLIFSEIWILNTWQCNKVNSPNQKGS